MHEAEQTTGPRRTRPAATPARALPARAAAAVVFLSAAAVLVLEIVAIRLIAPYVGVTLQTNTAVIGAALSAIAMGAWGGGRLADRTDPGRLLGPILVLGAALTMLTLPVVRYTGSATRGTAGASVVLLLAMIAVFAPAALLSAVTPMVVKLQLADLGQTGTVVGRLSGIGTLGAITATFVTGFVLVAALPTSYILLGTGAVLAVAGALVIWYRRAGRFPGRPSALVMVPILPALVVIAPNPCQVETAYHCAAVVPDQDRRTGRLLRLDTLRHSYVDLADPRHLEFAYIRAFAAVADTVRPAGAPIASLHVGGGGFTMPRYLAATRPGSAGTVLEIDPGVVELARSRLGADRIPRLRLRVGDARTLLVGEPDRAYDLVFGDAFGGVAVPWHLTTRETLGEIDRVLRAGGVYAVNVIDYPPDRFVRAETATLRSVFPHVALLADRDGGNHVLVASRRPLAVTAIAARLRELQPDWNLLDGPRAASYAGRAPVLRDDYAPVDQLISPFAR